MLNPNRRQQAVLLKSLGMARPCLVITISIAASLGSAACAKKYAAPIERKFVDDLRAEQPAVGPEAERLARLPEASNALAEAPLGACERLGKLSDSLADGKPVFSLLREVGREKKGSVSLSENPFTLFALGEKFVLDTPEAFLQMALEGHRAGHVSTLQIMALRTAWRIPSIFRSMQISATNDKLKEKFPGLFGEQDPLGGSLVVTLGRRAVAGPSGAVPTADAFLDTPVHAEILAARLPLYGSTRDSLASALTGIYRSNSELDRLCAVVLLQRSFSQLLSFKGYHSPSVTTPASGRSRQPRIAPLEKGDRESLRDASVGGAFADPVTGQRVVLSPEDIAAYDPARGVKLVAHPALAGPTQLASTLRALEVLVYLYEGTSPAAPWVREAGYSVLGDIQAANSRALVPADAHRLALGLLTMAFKNLGGMHVAKIGASGAILREGEAAAGITLLANPTAPGRAPDRTVVRVEDAATFSRAVIFLDKALADLAQVAPARLAELNPVYTEEKTVAKLVGSRTFSEARLAELLTAEERQSVLADKLAQLRMPLALLLARLLDNQGGCHARIDWDLRTGVTAPQGECNATQRGALRQALTVVGAHVRSSLLVRRAEELRR